MFTLKDLDAAPMCTSLAVARNINAIAIDAADLANLVDETGIRIDDGEGVEVLVFDLP